MQPSLILDLAVGAAPACGAVISAVLTRTAGLVRAASIWLRTERPRRRGIAQLATMSWHQLVDVWLVKRSSAEVEQLRRDLLSFW